MTCGSEPIKLLSQFHLIVYLMVAECIRQGWSALTATWWKTKPKTPTTTTLCSHNTTPVHHGLSETNPISSNTQQLHTIPLSTLPLHPNEQSSKYKSETGSIQNIAWPMASVPDLYFAYCSDIPPLAPGLTKIRSTNCLVYFPDCNWIRRLSMVKFTTILCDAISLLKTKRICKEYD